MTASWRVGSALCELEAVANASVFLLIYDIWTEATGIGVKYGQPYMYV